LSDTVIVLLSLLLVLLSCREYSAWV